MVKRLADNVYSITENMGSNNTAIITPVGVVLVDTPHKPTDAMAWRDFVEGLGPIKYVIITDHHIDHSLTNAFFGGELIAHEGTRKKLVENAPTHEFINNLLMTIDPDGIDYINDGYKYRIPDITVDNNMNLYLGDTEIRLLNRKGHTDNSLMVYLPKERIIITGDNVSENGLPCTDQTCFPEIYQTLDFIINTLDVEYVVPGHGEICTIKEVIRYKNQLIDFVKSVDQKINEGFSRQEISDTVRYEDRIHTDTPHYKGYPDLHNEGFQRRSVEHIYDMLMEQRYT